jgi:pimeloyl-ACP methyl ester carboxylesterase
MANDTRLRAAEAELTSRYALTVDETYLELPHVRLRVLSTGTGPDVVVLHGVSLAAAAWLPLLPSLTGYRLHLVELPGHGLSGPQKYRPEDLRPRSVQLVGDILDALDLASAPIIGHSLGAMFALWSACEQPGRISSLVAIGDPGVALPGVTVRMPLSLMTVRGIGSIFLRLPTTRSVYRRLFGQGMSPAAAEAAPDELLEVLRLSVRRATNVDTVASLMHALDHFRRPRAASVMTDDALRRVTTPTMFIWGHGDPYLSPARAQSSIDLMPAATLQKVTGGHGPWFEDPIGCATLITQHLTQTGFPPADLELTHLRHLPR